MPTYTKRTTGPRPRAKYHPLKSKYSAANTVAHRDDWADSITMPEAVPNPVLTPDDQSALNRLHIKPNPQYMTSVLRHAEHHPYQPPSTGLSRKLAHLKAQYHNEKKPVKHDESEMLITHKFKGREPRIVDAKGKPQERHKPLDVTAPPTFRKKS